MKPSEFSEVLIPPPSDKLSSAISTTTIASTGQQQQPPPPYVFTNIIGGHDKKKPKTSTLSKWFIFFTTLTILLLIACMVTIILRYENKMNTYESRINGLETTLDDFIEAFEIKALMTAIQKHDHDDDDGHEHEIHTLDSLEIDFSNDLMEPPAALAAKPQRPSSTQQHHHISPHHFRRISDMSDEDFVPEGDEESAEDEEEEPNNSSYDEYVATVTTIEGENINGKEEVEEAEVVFGELKLETPPHAHSQRKKRQISYERSEDGVPIIEGSYTPQDTPKKYTGNFLPVPTPTESEGLRLYESLVATRGVGEPKAPEYQESDGTNVLPYHRTSAAWTERTGGSRLELKSGDYGSSFGSTGPTIGSDYFYVRGQSRPTNPSSFGAGSNAVLRSRDDDRRRNAGSRSRTNYPPLRRLGEGDGEVVARVHQEGGEPLGQAASGANFDDTVTSFAESRHYKGGSRRNSSGGQRASSRQRQQPAASGNTRQRNVYEKDDEYDDDDSKDEFSFVKAEAWAEGPKTYVAHYVGDASNYSMSHRHYEGNGRLKNADGIFTDWKSADWMNGNEASKEGFVLNPNTGVVTVKKEGIYYIYAQVHYLDEHDINGFQIEINSEPFVQCTTMTETHHTNARKSKSNSCFTSGLSHLKENDQLRLKDVETNRFSIIKPEKNFFGLMRIGAVGSR